MTIKAIREPDLTAKHAALIYQVKALEATKDLAYAAIFHEQGLGKTKIGIDLSLHWLTNGIVDSVIIVTKRGLLFNWKEELKAHTHITPRPLSQDRAANFLAFNSPARIYLTHYEVLKAEYTRLLLFLKTRRVGIVLDEAHKIKNPDSETSKALFKLAPSFTRKAIMTGTPVANRPYDLWAQVFFLDAGASLGEDFSDFRAKLDLSNDLATDQEKATKFENSLGQVFQKIQSFSVRETKLSAGITLPEKAYKNVPVQLESRQAEIYKRFKDDCEMIILRDGMPELDNADDILKRLLRLIQVASNPRLVDDSYRGTPGKFPVLHDWVTEIIDREEKAIIWTSFTNNVDWLSRELRSFGAVRVHGKLSYEERERSLKSFKCDPDCKLLVATPASAKEGLTLTVANNAIFYDRSFSLEDYLQAQDRIHRISQTKACTIINLVGIDTIDEWIDVLLAAKQLAAQLGQGDITSEVYKEKANYAFGEILKDVLNSLRGEKHA